MPKQVMNMQLSQKKTVALKGATAYDTTADNVVELGFRPALVRGMLLNGDVPVQKFWWYSVEPGYTFTLEDKATGSDGFVKQTTNSFVEVTENGVILDGVKANAVDGDTDGVIFEAIGGNRIDSKCPIDNEAHPDAIDGGSLLSNVAHVKLVSDPDNTYIVNNEDYEVEVHDDNTEVQELIADLEAPDGSNQTYNVYANDSGSPDFSDEKTGATEVIDDYWLVVTSENGRETVEYQIVVGSSETDIQADSAEPTYIEEIDNDELEITVAAATEVDQLLGELESTDGSTQTYAIYEDDDGPNEDAEKTDTDALVTGDWLVVTSENENEEAAYQITVED